LTKKKHQPAQQTPSARQQLQLGKNFMLHLKSKQWWVATTEINGWQLGQQKQWQQCLDIGRIKEGFGTWQKITSQQRKHLPPDNSCTQVAKNYCLKPLH